MVFQLSWVSTVFLPSVCMSMEGINKKVRELGTLFLWKVRRIILFFSVARQLLYHMHVDVSLRRVVNICSRSHFGFHHGYSFEIAKNWQRKSRLTCFKTCLSLYNFLTIHPGYITHGALYCRFIIILCSIKQHLPAASNTLFQMVHDVHITM